MFLLGLEVVFIGYFDIRLYENSTAKSSIKSLSENDNVDVTAGPANYTHPTAYQPCTCSSRISTF